MLLKCLWLRREETHQIQRFHGILDLRPTLTATELTKDLTIAIDLLILPINY